MNIEAVQLIIDTTDPEEDFKGKAAELNQLVANGFSILAAPVVGTTVFYQLARVQQPISLEPGMLEKLRHPKGKS